MKHLRYLRINVEKLRNFPQCITRLRNLQILEFLTTSYDSTETEIELPTGFNELISLRSFTVNTKVIKFKDMPPGFGQLTALQKLSLFTVGKNNGIDALAKMDDLSGQLEIHYQKHRVEAVSEAKAANLKGKKVTYLILRWPSSYRKSTTQQVDEEEEDLVLQWLQPPPTIRRLGVRGWTGRRFPYWGTDKFPTQCSLPCLVCVHIYDCQRCKHLPPFSRLPHLKFLVLRDLGVEYIETGGDHRSLEYFPSLERLELKDLHELKGWSKEDEDEDVDEEQQKYLQTQERRILPNLADLKIEKCKMLMSMHLVVPRLESLSVSEIHGKGLQDLLSVAEQSTKEITTMSTTTSSSSSSMTLSRLRKLSIDSVDELEHLSIDLSSSLEELTIKVCRDLSTLTAERPSSLRQLHIEECWSLRDISGALQYLSDLEVLEITSMGSTCVTSLATAESWQGLKSLRSLELTTCREMQSLPSGLGCLSMLQKLRLYTLASLRTLPEWIGNLTQLQLLRIDSCDQLSAIPVLPPSLRRFDIYNCNKLVDISAALQHLSLLEVLVISRCDNLDLWEESKSAAAWQGLESLRSLTLGRMECLTSLPRGLECLTTLEELEFVNLKNLRAIPEWIGHLTQLHQLVIWNFPELTALPSSLSNLTALQLKIYRCPGFKDD